MSSISAGTTTTTGYVVTSDTTGALVLKTGASGTTAVTIDTSQNVTFAAGQTFSAGTANGVTYLNGSKVLTSGSALTYNGTVLYTNGKIGVGETNPTALVEARNTSIARMDADSSAVYFGSGNNYPVVFKQNDTEGMRLTSTGLGIGTSSPSSRLDIAGSATAGMTLLQQIRTGTGNSYGFQIKGNYTTEDYIIQNYYSAALAFGTNNTERMRLDSAGNLALGTTPSAWGSGSTAFQLGNGGIWKSGSRSVDWIVNGYYNGTNYIYNQTAAATYYRQYDGQHLFFNAASGTAGNAITFTQAMTLDASGNLGVGVTNPGNKITLPNNSFIAFRNTSAAETGYIGMTSGNLMSYSDKFYTDSSGRLLVGSSTTNSSNATTQVQITYSSNTGPGLLIADSTIQNNSTFASFVAGTTKIGSITSNGTTAVLYNLTSDQRLKENIENSDSASNLIDSLQVRQYDWKSDGSHQRYGFIAQELVTVAPEAVYQPNDPDEMMAVDYSKLVPMLVKEIQSLRARVAQLETN